MFVPVDKRSKKAQKEYYKGCRFTVCHMNTGTRTHKTLKNPTRAMMKRMDRKILKDY